MKKLKKILRFVKPYWRHVFLTVIFNILSVVFNVVSLVFFISVLNILFDKTKLVYSAPAFTMSIDSITKNFSYTRSRIIITSGSVTALMYICILVVGFCV